MILLRYINSHLLLPLPLVMSYLLIYLFACVRCACMCLCETDAVTDRQQRSVSDQCDVGGLGRIHVPCLKRDGLGTADSLAHCNRSQVYVLISVRLSLL